MASAKKKAKKKAQKKVAKKPEAVEEVQEGEDDQTVTPAEMAAAGLFPDPDPSDAPDVPLGEDVDQAPESNAYVIVTGREQGFWRAGIKFTRASQTLRFADLTPQQCTLLEAEIGGKMLSVSKIYIP